jgi:CO/xanthine dehydrogenase Mo-binding subunit
MVVHTREVETEVVRYAAVDDVGKVSNRLLCEGQCMAESLKVSARR